MHFFFRVGKFIFQSAFFSVTIFVLAFFCMVSDRLSCFTKVLARSESFAVYVSKYFPITRSSVSPAYRFGYHWPIYNYKGFDPRSPATYIDVFEYLFSLDFRTFVRDPLLDATPRPPGVAIEVPCCVETFSVLAALIALSIFISFVTRPTFVSDSKFKVFIRDVVTIGRVGRAGFALLVCTFPAFFTILLVRPVGWFWASIGYQTGFGAPLAYSWVPFLMKMSGIATLIIVSFVTLKILAINTSWLRVVREARRFGVCQACGFPVANPDRCVECGVADPGLESPHNLTNLGSRVRQRLRPRRQVALGFVLLALLWTSPWWLGLLGVT